MDKNAEDDKTDKKRAKQMKKPKFNFDSCITLTDEIIKNLIQLKKYNRFSWFVEVLTL